MKTKLSFSTIRLLYLNTDPYGDLTHKLAVKEILNRPDYLQGYINDLEHDLALTKEDTWPELEKLDADMRKSVKELKQLL